MDHHEHQPHGAAGRTASLEETAATAPVGKNAQHDMSAGGPDRHAGHSVAMFRDKFWLSLALTIPVVLLSPDIQTWFSRLDVGGRCDPLAGRSKARWEVGGCRRSIQHGRPSARWRRSSLRWPSRA